MSVILFLTLIKTNSLTGTPSCDGCGLHGIPYLCEL